MSYAEYLASAEWKIKRAAALERAGHRCQLCAYQGRNIEVHHNSYDNVGDERPEDLIVLCTLCHRRHHMTQRPHRQAPDASALDNLKLIAKALRERKEVA